MISLLVFFERRVILYGGMAFPLVDIVDGSALSLGEGICIFVSLPLVEVDVKSVPPLGESNVISISPSGEFGAISACPLGELGD